VRGVRVPSSRQSTGKGGRYKNLTDLYSGSDIVMFVIFLEEEEGLMYGAGIAE